MQANDTSRAELQSQIERHLNKQGIDTPLAAALAGALIKHALTWQISSPCPPDDCSAMMALSFGYRLSASGSRRPGPVNEALAGLVLNHYRRRPRPVFAQKEIATLLAHDIPVRHFYPIQPTSNRNGTKATATEAVLASIAEQLGDPQRMAPWLLIAHSHHGVRCAMAAESHGFGQVVLPELPAIYDHQSAQVWRRRHLPYLVNDIISRLSMYATNCLHPAIVRAAGPEKPTSDRSTAIEATDYGAIPCHRPVSEANDQPVPPAGDPRRGDWSDAKRTNGRPGSDRTVAKPNRSF